MSTQKGFSLIELAVSISIIAILSGIVLASISQARERARDERRLADLQQIQIALEQFRSVYGHFPCEDDTDSDCPSQNGGGAFDGIRANGEVGVGGNIDTMLGSFLRNVPHDPLGPGNGAHLYYYDGDSVCGGQNNQAVLFATTMEGNGDINFNDTICSNLDTEGRVTGDNSNNIILGESSG